MLVNDIWGATDDGVGQDGVGVDARRRAAHAAARRRHPRHHQPLRPPAADQAPGGLVVEVTDGTDEYNATNYRVSFFYDLAKAASTAMAFALAHELAPYGATAVVAHAGLAAVGGDARGVRRHRGELARRHRADRRTSPSPRARRSSGRAVAALAADPDVARWNGQSLSSGQLAQVYGFTDLDGSQPDAWRYVPEVQDAGKPADVTGYR